MRNAVRSIWAAAALLLAAMVGAGEAQARSKYARGEHTADTLLVRFKASAGEATQAAHLRGHKARKLKDFGRLVPGLQTWQLPKGAHLDAVLEALRADPDVAYAEPDHLQYALAFPNDPSFNQLWGLHNTGQTSGIVDADIDAPEAWDISTGNTDVIVGVIDTGIDYNHQDLAANMWRNTGELAGNGVDDDGNGYVDDVYGWNAYANTGDPLDDHNHGTHCAGTIGAVGNNGIGVVGVAWNVRLMALKFLSASGSGSTADAIESINYAVQQKNRGVNLRVLSNSWGGGGFSQALLDAINAAAAAGILFVAAAGNNTVNNDTTPHYPSSYDAPNVVAVASTTSTDGLSSFSNYGATSVDLGAPGSSILSTTRNNTYATYNGTSMATPHVSGAAALMLSVNPSLTHTQLKQLLLETVDPISALNGKTVSGGRLNAYRAVSSVGTPVPGFQLSVGPATATVSQGQTASFSIATTPTNGFTGSIHLSVSSFPALSGATVSLTPNPVAAGGTASLSIATTTGTTAGTYNLTITGTGGTVTRSAYVTLTVDPEGTVTVSYANNTVTSIPDNNTTGITSTIQVPDSLGILSMSVGVDITHTYIGDLEVSLISPSGTTVVLHNRTGGSTDNLHQTYSPTAFNEQNSFGTWTLKVRDMASVDVGTLDRWTLTIKGAPASQPPPDTTPPLVTITQPANGATVAGNVTVTASATDDRSVSEVRFYADGTLIGTDTSSPYSVVWNTTGLAGSRSLTAQASDPSGNVGNAPTVNVTVSSDTTPPVISNVGTRDSTASSVVITWRTDEAADSQVQYGTTTSYGSWSSLSPSLVTSHSIGLTGLRAKTTYHFRVKSVDAAGNVSYSANQTFETDKL